MLKNLLLTIGIILTANILVFSQGSLQGKVVDKETNEPIPFVNIIVELGGTMVGGGASDFDGNFVIKPITPGKYDVKATAVGYRPMLLQGMVIFGNRITFYDLIMEATAENLDEFEIVEYVVPLINKDQTSSGASITKEEISKMPNRSANAVASTVGGVFSADGERGNVRGSRSEGTVMYIDGIRVRGSSNLPQSAIEQVDVILSGLPASYGDATGGIISVTTRGPSRTFGAGVEMQTSQFLDAFGYNRLGFNVQGPLIKGQNKNGTALLGYFIAGDANYNKDGRPSAIGIYKVKDDVLASLKETPQRVSGTGFGVLPNAYFVNNSDLEHMKSTQNTENSSFSISGNLNVRTTETTTLTFGGSMFYNNYHAYNYYNSLFNYENNSQVITDTWRVYGKFTQRFPSNNESNSLIKNIYYSIQADYSKTHTKQQDPKHKDNLFKYGYLGKYETHTIKSYELGEDTVNGSAFTNVWLHNGFFDTAYVFTKSDINSEVANYTKLYYELYPNKWGNYDPITHGGLGNWLNSDQLQLGGGLLNGQVPDAVYGLWANAGAKYNGYNVGDYSQIGINAKFSADIGKHEFQFGLQYEQRIDRGYGYAPTNLWSLMRGLTNFHILELDVDNPQLVYRDGVFQDTIFYYRKHDEASQRIFDYNLRKKLGLDPNGTDFINIDSYDMDSYSINYYDKDGNLKTITLDEELLSIDMFSPDELLNNGSSYVGYYGYDYTGKKLTNNPSMDDFFNRTVKIGNKDVYTREIDAFRPIYMAGYIQDKFAFKDLIFNVGLRIDRFDANQMVLKDPYLLFPSQTVAQALQGSPDLFSIPKPSNIGNNYTVYVDDIKNPTTIVGYREGNKWFSADGTEVTNPSIIDPSGIKPLLIDKNANVVTSESFKDYEPQISVMPRLSFSFPISDEALFFAHYDVLTQRPTEALRMNPMDYYFFATNTDVISNPNLKPTKTIDYELGFQQKLTNSSSLSFSAFYKEMRDMIQYYRYLGAYPKEYDTYINYDFGTVKGVTVSYDLRRTNNVRIRAAYTLQFANGTGSNSETSAALVTSGQPNLRTLNPLNWDRRHAINLLLDYRYGEGKKYNGPSIRKKIKGTDKYKTVQILKNTGFNMTFNGGSGTPYSKSSRIVRIGSGGEQLQGSINGSHLPWQFRMDLRIDKDFYIKFKKKEGEDAKFASLNVYIQVLNVLDSKNIMGVYRATGNPDDDGYLAAAQYQTEIENQLDSQAYRDLYLIRINNPANYSAPRKIRLGVIFNF
ncbi:MAG: carboxypeptidase-like regulatory domain-containing protein [Bacteroidales bacterium]|nr:carboxypeptidase-like regulatory domain-containing protein [Bacteroidales bacterium]